MAIAYDNSASFTSVGSGTTSVSYTCSSGNDRYLIVGAGSFITGITYAGVAMTKIVDFEPAIHDGNQVHINVWGLANPASGSNTLATTIGVGDNEIIGIASYTGVNPNSEPEIYETFYSNNGLINTQVVSLSGSVTTITDNAWSIMVTRGTNAGQTFTASAGTLRTSDTSALSKSEAVIDSNAAITPAGSSTLTADWSSGSGFVSNVIMSFKPLTVPGAPTIGAVTPGLNSAQVAFTPNGDGGSAITSYTVTATPGGITATGGSSPITVTGLNQNVSYTFTVYATNAVGNSALSASSAAVTLDSSGLLLFFP